jgi:regulator of nucleoside diphosphate kinase
MTKPIAFITNRDAERLRELVNRLKMAAHFDEEEIAQLEQRVEMARVIDAEDIPRFVVTMNSLAGLRNLQANEKFSCSVTYPEEADLTKRKVSVATPLGRALLGSRVGDTIQCPVESGVRALRVERVYYQPEAARDFHL